MITLTALFGALLQTAAINPAHAADVCVPAGQPSQSIEGETHAPITFDNQTLVRVFVYWLNYSGERELWFDLDPGETHFENTWLTHPWVIVDGSNRCLGYVLADRESGKRYVIMPPLGQCDGITKGEVAGEPPNYGPSSLGRFPNDHAVCNAAWVPTLDQGFVPQGVALVGDGTALISGYKSLFFFSTSCRIVRVDLTSGVETGLQDFTNDCEHGGGIAFDASTDKVWLADTNALYVFELEDLFAGTTDPPGHRIELTGEVHGSFLGPLGRDEIYVGTWREKRSSSLYEFPKSFLEGASTVSKSDATEILTIPSGAQGADFGPSFLWVSSSTSKKGFLYCGVRKTRFGPGSEEIQFADDGSLWGVFEAGSLKYIDAPFFPVVARFDPGVLFSSCSGGTGGG